MVERVLLKVQKENKEEESTPIISSCSKNIMTPKTAPLFAFLMGVKSSFTEHGGTSSIQLGLKSSTAINVLLDSLYLCSAKRTSEQKKIKQIT